MGAMSFAKLGLTGAVWAAAKPDAQTKRTANLENGCMLKTASSRPTLLARVNLD